MDSLKITKIDTIIGLELKKQREFQQKTQTEMGKALGSSATRWAKLEKGSTAMSLSDMYEACGALQIDAQNFFRTIDELKGQLESDGWQIKVKLEQGEVDILQSYAAMNTSSFASVATIPLLGGLISSSITSSIAASLGIVAASYLLKRNKN